MFQAHVLNVRRPKLYYTASGIIAPIGDRPVHRLREYLSTILSSWRWAHVLETGWQRTQVLSQPVHRKATYRCDDTRGCIVQFWPPDDEHMCSKQVNRRLKSSLNLCTGRPPIGVMIPEAVYYNFVLLTMSTCARNRLTEDSSPLSTCAPDGHL